MDTTKIPAISSSVSIGVYLWLNNLVAAAGRAGEVGAVGWREGPRLILKPEFVL
jgi:hypothetical protein